jgi:phosphohistidine phosphatase
MARAAHGMRELELNFDLILTSPFLRASETAQIVATEFSNRRHLQQTELLKPGGNLKELTRHLAALHRTENLLLVGHEPQLSTLLATLLGARSPESFKMKKGALCLLGIEKIRLGPCAKLEWMLTCKQLARLAE